MAANNPNPIDAATALKNFRQRFTSFRDLWTKSKGGATPTHASISEDSFSPALRQLLADLRKREPSLSIAWERKMLIEGNVARIVIDHPQPLPPDESIVVITEVVSLRSLSANDSRSNVYIGRLSP